MKVLNMPIICILIFLLGIASLLASQAGRYVPVTFEENTKSLVFMDTTTGDIFSTHDRTGPLDDKYIDFSRVVKGPYSDNPQEVGHLIFVKEGMITEVDDLLSDILLLDTRDAIMFFGTWNDSGVVWSKFYMRSR